MSELGDIAAASAGLGLVLLGLFNLFEAVLLPRPTHRRSPMYVATRCTIRAVAWFAERTGDGRTRDRRLAWAGPLSIVASVLVCLTLLWFGFALALAPCTANTWSALRESGSSMLTLGFESTPGVWPTLVDLAASVAGFAVITLSIGFLPTLYGAYNRRERFLIAVEAQAGRPVDALALLGSLGKDGDRLWREARRWAADIAESHVSYSPVALFRSPQPERAWVLGMWTLLDGAALAASVRGDEGAARHFVRTGTTCLREVARALNLEPISPPAFELPSADVDRGLAVAAEHSTPTGAMAGGLETARASFLELRDGYEPWAEALARATFAPRTPWCGGDGSGEPGPEQRRPAG